MTINAIKERGVEEEEKIFFSTFTWEIVSPRFTHVSLSQFPYEYWHDEAGYGGDTVRHRHQGTGEVWRYVYVIRQETAIHAADAGHRDRHQHDRQRTVAADVRYADQAQQRHKGCCNGEIVQRIENLL